MLPILTTYVTTTVIPAAVSVATTTFPAIASTVVYAETLLASSAPALAIGFTAGAYLSHRDNFKEFITKLLAPTKAQVVSSVVKSIMLDGALTFHFTHDPIGSAKAAATSLPSYFIRAIHDDPATACLVGAGKYAIGGKSLIAGCINHALYNKQFDQSGAIGAFLFTSIVEVSDHLAKKSLKNETIELKDFVDAGLIGGVSGVVVTNELIPVLNYITPADSDATPSILNIALRAIGTFAAGEAITGISYRNYTDIAIETIEHNFNYSLAEMFHNEL